MFDFTSEGGNSDEIEFEILSISNSISSDSLRTISLMVRKLSDSFYKNLHNFDENFNLKFTSICTRLVEF